MQPGRVAQHEELSRGRLLSQDEKSVMDAVGSLTWGGKKKKARAMRRALRVLEKN
jgi:hypothetical protein